MTRRIIASLAAAGVAILASCTQDQRPSALLPTEASLARTTTPTCSFTTITSDAKNIYVNSTGSTKDQVFTLIDAMSAAYKIGGADAATSAGFDVLRRYGVGVGDATIIKSTVTAAALSLAANNVLLCMSVPGFTYSADQFTPAFGPSGLFAVRSTSDAAPSAALAHSLNYGVEATSGFWPLTGSLTLTGSVVGKALFYAAPVSSVSAQFDDPLGGPTVIDIKSLPAPLTFDPKLRVGFCDVSNPRARILHVHSGDPALVLPESDPTFCTGDPVTLNAPSSMFASAVQTLGSWIAPAPAYAASRSMMFGFFGGGTVGGLSEIGPIEVQDTLFINTIPNASVSDTIKTLDADTVTTLQFSPVVTVRALTKSGMNPIGGALITLTVIGNKGSFVPSGNTATTDLLGYARFPNLSINKAGGYTISAQGEFGTSTSTSNLFNINGQ